MNLATPPGVERIDVESAAEMCEATLARIGEADIYIGAAAISDYRPDRIAEHKIKKHSDRMILDMGKSKDLLATIAAMPGRPFTVGFAAETEKLEEHARRKLEGKRLDMIVANLVGRQLGFDAEDNSAVLLWADGSQALGQMSKTELARRIVAVIAARYRQASPAPATLLRAPGAS